MAGAGGQRWDGCDADVRAFAERVAAALRTALRTALGDSLAGIYLHGSLATGCYYRAKSDIDLLAVVRERLDADTRRRLSHLLLALSDARPTTGDLELSVVLERDARAFAHPMPYELHFGESLKEAIRRGEMDYAIADRHDRDLAAHCTVVRARGVALAGPPPAEMFGPVPPEAFLDAVLDDFAWIAEGDHILESPFYATLNACRVLQLLAEGGGGVVANKEEGALWALAHLPAEHHPVIRRALDCYRSASPVTPESRRTGGVEWGADALRAFRDYAVEQVGRLRGRG